MNASLSPCVIAHTVEVVENLMYSLQPNIVLHIVRNTPHQSLEPRMMSDEPSRPMQAFKNASRPLRCLLRLFTTSVPAQKQ